MKEYEILIETINPCGGETHAQREIIEASAESEESYAASVSPYPVIDTVQLPSGDKCIITGNGKGRMVRYTFTEI